jgi:hypothetical protein
MYQRLRAVVRLHAHAQGTLSASHLGVCCDNLLQ